MASYNKVLLMGNLTRDAQLSYLPSQTAVIEFTVATNRRFKKQDGSQGEEACFTDCQMFGKRAEALSKYLTKGGQILVEGRLKLDTWQGPDGKQKSRLRVFVEDLQLMGTRPQQGSQYAPAAEQDYLPEDIPF